MSTNGPIQGTYVPNIVQLKTVKKKRTISRKTISPELIFKSFYFPFNKKGGDVLG